MILTRLSVNQNSLRYRMRFSVGKNISVVVKSLLCHSTGCPVIHDPRQVCVDLINMNSRALVPRNDFDFVPSLINGSQLFLTLLEAYRICEQWFYYIKERLILKYFHQSKKCWNVDTKARTEVSKFMYKEFIAKQVANILLILKFCGIWIHSSIHPLISFFLKDPWFLHNALLINTIPKNKIRKGTPVEQNIFSNGKWNGRTGDS